MEKITLGDYHYYEVLDRSYVCMDSFNDYVAEHVAVQANPELKEKAEEIMILMYQFYSLSAVYGDEELSKKEGINRAEVYEYEEDED